MENKHSFIPPASKTNADFLVEKASSEITSINKYLSSRYLDCKVKAGLIEVRKFLKAKINFYNNYYPKN
jgi:hypothetical protein